MSVYRRFFQIKDEKTLTEIAILYKAVLEYKAALHLIKTEIGAKDLYVDNSSGHLAGFGFSPAPDMTMFRKVEYGVYLPKKSSKLGKVLYDRINAIPKPVDINEALRGVGLIPGFSGALNEGMRFHMSSIGGSDSKGWFAAVPWKDVDPEELKKYRAADSMERRSSTFDHLLWVPPAEWVELKQWQVEKAMADDKVEA